jgi:integrase
MPIVSLNQATIAMLKCPEGKGRIEYCDKDLPGLLLEVRPSGASTYHLRYKANGQTKYIKLGTSDLISLAEARKKAKTLKAEIALGADPRGEAKKQKAVLTFSEFMENHYLPYIKNRKRSGYSDESIYRVHLKGAFGNTRLNQITRQQIQTLHTAILDSGRAPATANHSVKLLRHACNLAIDWDMLDTNPAARVPLFFEDNKKENYLSDDELNKLLTVLHSDPNHMASRIALFLLSTGCRLNEALSAKWSDVDMEKRAFTVRASNSKSKKLRSVPLNKSAIDVLNQMAAEGEFEYVFHNKLTEKPMTSINRTWNRLRIRAGLPHLRIHDLRHMYASFLVNGGRTLYEVQQILGHSDPKVTMRYAHLSARALASAAETASVMMHQGLKVKPLEIESSAVEITEVKKDEVVPAELSPM